MKKILIRLVAITAIALMAISLVIGCKATTAGTITAAETTAAETTAAATTAAATTAAGTTAVNPDIAKYGLINGKEWIPPTVARGTTLRILWQATPEADILQEQAKEFTEKTGINIVWDIATREDAPLKLVRELIEEAGSYDLAITGISEAATYVGKGHYIPIEPYLTPEELQLFYSKQWVTDPRTNKMAGIAQYNNWHMLYYRSDLLNDPDEQAAFKTKYGRDLTVPTTNAELAQVCEFFNRPPNMYGYAIGGVDFSLRGEFTHYLYGQGKDVAFGDKDGNLALNTPEAIQAMKEMVEITKYAPPGWETRTFFDNDTLMLNGKTFAYTNWTYEWAQFQKDMPGKIDIVEPTQQGTVLSGYVALIPVKTQNLDAAVAFQKFIGAYHIQKDHFIKTGGNFPARSDVFEDPDVKSAPGFEVLQKPSAYAKPFNITWYSEASTGIHDAFFDVVNGKKTVEEAMNWLVNVKFAGRKITE